MAQAAGTQSAKPYPLHQVPIRKKPLSAFALLQGYVTKSIAKRQSEQIRDTGRYGIGSSGGRVSRASATGLHLNDAETAESVAEGIEENDNEAVQELVNLAAIPLAVGLIVAEIWPWRSLSPTGENSATQDLRRCRTISQETPIDLSKDRRRLHGELHGELSIGCIDGMVAG